MKKLALIFVTAISLLACTSEDKKAGSLSDEERKKALKDSSRFTTIQWLDSTSRDLGQIKEGVKPEISYRFKNTGDHNLILSDVQPSCGCTTPEWPKQPIAPGQEGVIKAVFNSEHRVGPNVKEIHVVANTRPESSMALSFKVEVTENK